MSLKSVLFKAREEADHSTALSVARDTLNIWSSAMCHSKLLEIERATLSAFDCASKSVALRLESDLARTIKTFETTYYQAIQDLQGKWLQIESSLWRAQQTVLHQHRTLCEISDQNVRLEKMNGKLRSTMRQQDEIVRRLNSTNFILRSEAEQQRHQGTIPQASEETGVSELQCEVVRLKQEIKYKTWMYQHTFGKVPADSLDDLVNLTRHMRILFPVNKYDLFDYNSHLEAVQKEIALSPAGSEDLYALGEAFLLLNREFTGNTVELYLRMIGYERKRTLEESVNLLGLKSEKRTREESYVKRRGYLKRKAEANLWKLEA